MMDLQQARKLVAQAAENVGEVSTGQLALACATVLYHGGLMAIKPLELPQNTVLVVQER